MNNELHAFKECLRKMRLGLSTDECVAIIEKYKNPISQLPDYIKIEIMKELDIDDIFGLCDSTQRMNEFCHTSPPFRKLLCDKYDSDYQEEIYGCKRQSIIDVY